MAGQQKDITIVGGGIIGCCAAYFLTRHPAYSADTHRITLLEASSSSSGGRTADSLQDPASLLPPESASKRNPAHEGIAGGASGKAGGLLALWAFPQNIVPLSFRLHDELAKEHGGDTKWGYRRCYASQVDCSARLPPGFTGGKDEDMTAADNAQSRDGNEEGASKGLHKDHKKSAKALKRLGAPEDLDWLDAEKSLGGVRKHGDARKHGAGAPRTVHAGYGPDGRGPGRQDRDGRQGHGHQQKQRRQERRQRRLREGRESRVAAHDRLRRGGWAVDVQLLPRIPVTASRAHSVVIKTPRTVSPYALFTAINLPSGFPSPTPEDRPGSTTQTRQALRRMQIVEPEIYARPDGTAYACGPTDQTAPLPATNAEVEVDEARCRDILDQVGSISDDLGRDGRVLARQACYLPQGGPFIGEVGGTQGLTVAAGHTCWGIQNAPGTGKLISEIVLEGVAKSAKLGGCDPSRLT
ncbi:uncharacterized protein PG998_000022 [Apiospora kogelbergensis]|uniref:uncharacterized protein n=1 Tax=Apiospora kogelbergensis TaxID=1337665 RepID=UPI00312D1D7F